MNYEILEALGQIAREKNVDKDLVIETLEAGIVSAARRRYGMNADVRVVFDHGTGGMKIEYVRRVVEDLTDEELEIELDDAQLVQPDIQVGDELVVELSLAEFGRNAIQAAKQVVVQRVREAERENVYENYHTRVGEIVTGTVQQVNRGNIIVNLGRAEALLPWREQIRREQYRQGDTVRALIIDVQKNTKGPQIILSRGSGDFLVKLFEQEVPEIMEGIVRIEAVAREAGGRSKIAVSSTELRVDPVGACVGMKGSRVQGIVRELSGERIDIVPHSDDPIAFVTKALSPARILQTIPDDETKRMKVIVTEDQLSLAIGKSGQNARLAAKLSGWEIDLVSEEEFAISRGDTPRADHIPVNEMEGLGPKTVESLVQSGFESVQDIVKATIEDLINVPGVGDVTAQKIYLAAVQHLEAVAERAAAQAAEEEAQAAAEEEAQAAAEEEAQAAAEQEAQAAAAAETPETTAEEVPDTAEPESGAAVAESAEEPPEADTTAEADRAGTEAEPVAAEADESEEATPEAVAVEEGSAPPSEAEPAREDGPTEAEAPVPAEAPESASEPEPKKAASDDDSLLAELDAMESELAAGWKETEEEKKKKKKKKKTDSDS